MRSDAWYNWHFWLWDAQSWLCHWKIHKCKSCRETHNDGSNDLLHQPSYGDSAAEAAAELQRLLKETPDDKIVLGHTMNEVWIVFYDAYEDFWVNNVFDSEEKAMAFIAGKTDYRVEKHTVT